MKAKHILSNLIEKMNIVFHNKKEEMHCQLKKRRILFQSVYRTTTEGIYPMSCAYDRGDTD